MVDDAPTPVAICLVIPQRMCLSGTITEIWHLKDNEVTTLIFLGSRDIISRVTIRLLGVDFLWVVYSDHAAIWHRYGDMAV